jgi:enoyl-CoA hydratase
VGVHVDRSGPASVVTLDWPDVRNALGPQEAGEIADAIDAASRMPVSAVVLTGTGAFCAGGDLTKFADLSKTHSPQQISETIYDHIHAVLRALRRSPVPTIAAVDGAAVGLGFDYALACDMRIVGPGGWFQQGWARAGLIPAAGGAAFLMHLAPHAVWSLLDQQRLDASAAEKLHIAERDDTSALEGAIRRATQLSQLPEAVRSAYVELTRPLRWPKDEYLERCRVMQSDFIGSAEFRRRAEALLEASGRKR